MTASVLQHMRRFEKRIGESISDVVETMSAYFGRRGSVYSILRRKRVQSDASMTAEHRLHRAWDHAGSQNDSDTEEAEVFRR